MGTGTVVERRSGDKPPAQGRGEVDLRVKVGEAILQVFEYYRYRIKEFAEFLSEFARDVRNALREKGVGVSLCDLSFEDEHVKSSYTITSWLDEDLVDEVRVSTLDTNAVLECRIGDKSVTALLTFSLKELSISGEHYFIIPRSVRVVRIDVSEEEEEIVEEEV